MTPHGSPETMLPAWPLLVVGAVGLVLLALLLAGPLVFRGRGRRAVTFYCPFRRQRVTTSFRVSEWDWRRLGVERCSAFAPPDDVRCDKECLDARLPGLGPPRDDSA